MYPMYGHMDSYPHQRPYVPYNQNTESIPYQTKPDFSKHPSPYEYPPYGMNSNYTYPHPMGFHSCCNHNYFPSYYAFHPSYTHFQPLPPQPFHFLGSYPPHPHYPVELLPRYDYDKNIPREHCYGCPNQSCNRKDNPIVKMEEPDPDAEKKSDSLVTRQFDNNSYPIVWIPHGYLKNKEDLNGKYVEVESKDKETNKDLNSFEEVPRFLSGCLPLDMTRLGSLAQREDGRNVEQKKEEEGRFPFPIFRVPYNPEKLEKDSPRENKLPSHFSITPMDASDTEDSKSKCLGKLEKKTEKFAPEEVEKKTGKFTPEEVEKKTGSAVEGKARDIPVEFRTDNEVRKIMKNNEKRRPSTSSPKSSGLRPVCLRVDPLPGKKHSSRSPGPTANTGTSVKSTSENPKSCQEKLKSSEMVDKRKEVKVVEVVENDSKNGRCGSENSSVGENVISDQVGDGKCEVGEGKDKSEMMKEKDREQNRVMRKVLSDVEAAVIIQSAYRGYEVRRWEPLIKLEQIAKVKDQVAEVKRSIEALELSTDGVECNDKQRLVIGENIMSLLLKLDTIQGLHPSIRDIRKLVARDLVNLQEKLDALTIKKPFEDHSAAAITTRETCEAAEKTGGLPVLKDANVDEHDKVLGIVNHEELESKQSDEVFSVDAEQMSNRGRDAEKEALRRESTCANDPAIVEDITGNVEDVPKADVMKTHKENNNKVGGKEVEDLNNANEHVVVENITGRVEESLVSDDKAIRGDGVVLCTETERLKVEMPLVGEENDTEVTWDGKAETNVRPAPAVEEEEFVHTEDAITGKMDVGAVQHLEDEVIHADGKIEPQEARIEEEVHLEEAQGKEIEPQEARIEEEVQLEEAQGKEIDHIEDEDTRKMEVFEVHPLQDKVIHANNEIQLEESRLEEEAHREKDAHINKEDSRKTQEFEVQPFEDEVAHGNKEAEPVESEEKFVLRNKPVGVVDKTTEEVGEIHAIENDEIGTQVTDKENGKFSVPKEDIVVSEVKAVVNGDGEIVANGVCNVDEKLREENEKLKEMVEKLIEAGKEQLSAISSLSGKVKDLERKLSKKKKLKMR